MQRWGAASDGKRQNMKEKAMREGSEETDGRGGMEEGRIRRFVLFWKKKKKKNAWRRKLYLELCIFWGRKLNK